MWIRRYAIILLLISVGIVAACSNAQKANDLQIIWHAGECLLVADGLLIEQAQSIQKEWQFAECEVNVGSDSGKKD